MHFGWQRGAYGLQPPTGQQPWIPPEPATRPLFMGRPANVKAMAKPGLLAHVAGGAKAIVAKPNTNTAASVMHRRPPLIVARGAKRADPHASRNLSAPDFLPKVSVHT